MSTNNFLRKRGKSFKRFSFEPLNGLKIEATGKPAIILNICTLIVCIFFFLVLGCLFRHQIKSYISDYMIFLVFFFLWIFSSIINALTQNFDEKN